MAVLKFFKRLIVAMAVLFLGVHVVIAVVLAVWSVTPVNFSMFMLSHRLSGGDVLQTWVDYSQIAQPVKQAAIVSEDARFVEHYGFDFESMGRAMRINEQAGSITIGGSTISQQLAKNLFLTSHRSYIRKAEEAIITVIIEQFWSKQRILEVYLNVVEFGEGIYGIEAAARHYFQKSAHQLSREQAALLIGMLPNPKYYGKNLQAKRLKNRQRIILSRMKSARLPSSH